MIPEREFFIDYHVHPYYSLDAAGSVDDYCEKATSLGFSEIAFTPHLELDLYRKALDDKVRMGSSIVSMRSDWLASFVRDVESAKRKYPIQIKVGVEVGYDEGTEEELREILNRYPFDFCLGAIHCLDHVAITDRREYELYYRNRSPEEVLCNYFSMLRKAISSQLFDGVAHLDVYKKYGLRYYGNSILELEKEFIGNALKDLAKHNIVLEINTSGIRTIGSPYPSESILRLARNHGVSSVIIGSDCHSVEQLGYGIKEALKLVQSIGFTLCGFRSRKVYRIGYGMEPTL